MVPQTGAFSCDDVSIELGNSAGTPHNLSSNATYMCNSSSPYNMVEYRGFTKADRDRWSAIKYSGYFKAVSANVTPAFYAYNGYDVTLTHGFRAIGPGGESDRSITSADWTIYWRGTSYGSPMGGDWSGNTGTVTLYPGGSPGATGTTIKYDIGSQGTYAGDIEMSLDGSTWVSVITFTYTP